MTIRIKLFAILRDRANCADTSLSLPEGASVNDAAQALAKHIPAIADYLPRIAFAVNQSYVPRATVLRDNDELALIPPVSGGSAVEIDDIRILATPLDVARAVAFVSDPNAGGIDLFLGTTRAETQPGGRELIALDYEAYEPMAITQLHTLAADARKKWPIIKLALLHRTGRVALAEPSVLIAVSTPHRAESFDACRWLIDLLKKDVAIWKKEVWSDGAATWVHPTGGDRSDK